MIYIENNPHELHEQLVMSPACIEEALSPSEIDEILKAVDGLELREATIDYEVNKNLRSCRTSWLPYSDKNAWIYGRLYDLVQEANDKCYLFEPIDMVEHIMYCEYDVDDHYAWHTDIASPPPFSGRKLAVTVQLSNSDDYRGGTLMFNTGSIYTAPRSIGTMIVYPSYLLHSVEPIRSGKRRSLVFWVGGNNLK